MAVTQRLLAAINAHDLESFVACFAVDYHSEQPAHPGRAFDGRDQVRENWRGVFAGIPDLVAEVSTSTRWCVRRTGRLTLAERFRRIAGTRVDAFSCHFLVVAS